ncbi:TPA: SIR2 family protein [Klebsiella pneumoniae]|nr:SIR2 family protein [Klebsiella pneumoniae]
MINLTPVSFSEYDLNEILNSSQDNKLVLFIGAGFSKFSETELVKIPTWSELISDLKDELGLPDETDFLKIAQLYYLKYGENSYVKKVKATIRDLDPSPFHKALFELNPHYIITTNWDGLLEKTAQDIGLAYDLVSSDVDLAQSYLDKKIIKMHGDFRKNNFVFKEDDYLQYSQNFPLIENFIKGIFSTSTVLFLGYSYSDYDLKQIVSWVTTISKATPRKYLLQKNNDDAQALYLRNHGISLLTPMSTDISYHELYSKFFSDFQLIKNQNEFIKRMIICAELELEKIEHNLTISNLEKDKLKTDIQTIVTKKINKYVDGKLKTLTQYKTLLPEQISKKLTNSTIDYDNSGITLISHTEILTGDYDKYSRKINSIYLDDILGKNSAFKKTFSSLLEKAFINKVSYNSKFYQIASSSELESELYNKLSFAYSKDSAEILLINKEYGKLLENLISKVKYHLNERNYILATIYMSNFDDTYTMLKRDLRSNSEAIDDACKRIIENHTQFYFKSKIIDFPRAMQNDLQDLVNILEFNEIYRAYYRFDVESKKNLQFSQIRKGGGIAFYRDEFKTRAKLYPYVYFILGNEILIEEYTEVKTLFEFNMLASLEHYLSEGVFYVNIIDLFILIKYCDTRKIKRLLINLTSDKKIITVSSLDKKELYHIKKYLLITLKNICDLMMLKSENSIFTTSIELWTNNVLLLLGCVQWSQNQLKKIIENLIPLLEVRTYNIDIYEGIQTLLAVNEILYQNSHPHMLIILDVMLKKITTGELNGYDHHIITSNVLRNIYILSKNHNYTYENAELLKRALTKIQLLGDEWKKSLTDSLLLKIRKIGSQEVVDIIDRFIAEDILNLPIITPKDILERLNLVANGYPVPNQFIELTKKFASELTPEKLTELDYITAGVEDDFPKLIKFIIEDKGLVDFQDALNTFYERIPSLK